LQELPGQQKQQARGQQEPVFIVEADLGIVKPHNGRKNIGGRPPEEHLCAVLDTDTGERKLCGVMPGGQIRIPSDIAASTSGKVASSDMPAK
jgi:hypothetical protein